MRGSSSAGPDHGKEGLTSFPTDGTTDLPFRVELFG
jgi:hypothetical protein